MHIGSQVKQVEQIGDNEPFRAGNAQPLGHVLSVGGSQVTLQFSSKNRAACESNTDVTVGAFSQNSDSTLSRYRSAERGICRLAYG
jgi:hypothetical protein